MPTQKKEETHMAEPTVAEGARITLGGKEREITISLYAMRQFKKSTGIDLLREGTGALARENLDTEKMIALIWACLVTDEPDLTEDDVARWVTMRNMGDVGNALHVALYGAMPEPEPTTEPPSEPTPDAPPNRAARRQIAAATSG
jgi:hypothetical protein